MSLMLCYNCGTVRRVAARNIQAAARRSRRWKQVPLIPNCSHQKRSARYYVCQRCPLVTSPPTNMDSTVMPLRNPDESKSNSTASEPIARKDDGGSATPKDTRFWLIITSLLIATFLAALDLTGKRSILLANIQRKADFSTKLSVPHCLPSRMPSNLRISLGLGTLTALLP